MQCKCIVISCKCNAQCRGPLCIPKGTLKHRRSIANKERCTHLTTGLVKGSNTMSKEYFEVQRHLDQVYVARQRSDLPQPQPGQALLEMIAAGVCNSDIRVVAGNKATVGEPERYVTLGHEGVGRIIALNESNTTLQINDR